MSSTDNRHAPDPPSGQYVTAQDDSPNIAVYDSWGKAVADKEKQVDPSITSAPQPCPTAPFTKSQGDLKPAPEDALGSHTQPVHAEDGSTALSKKTLALSLDSPQATEFSSLVNSATTQSSGMMEHSDPTPKAPRISQSSARDPKDWLSPTKGDPGDVSNAENRGITGLDGASKAKHDKTKGEHGDEGSKSEIQSIMEQFDCEGKLGEEDFTFPKPDIIGSPRQQESLKFPPRTSSLDPIGSASPGSVEAPTNTAPTSSHPGNTVNTQTTPSGTAYVQNSSLQSSTSPQSTRFEASEPLVPPSPQSSRSLPTALPPEPDPEPDLPFDFHRFLEQLRHRTADPVAKFLRSFLIEFGKKQWMVHEQVKIISDFLAFITNKMAQCEVWRGVSDAEFDNAKEGMEKLVMNRLYTQTFSPAIPSPPPVQDGKGKTKDLEKLRGPSRRGQHQEDIERDEILGQKVRIYRWVQEQHLDIAPVGDSGRRFLSLAQQGNGNSSLLVAVTEKVVELLKIKTYRAPRDKVICVLNCCKVIFGTLLSPCSPNEMTAHCRRSSA